jgi:hypothetical protein
MQLQTENSFFLYFWLNIYTTQAFDINCCTELLRYRAVNILILPTRERDKHGSRPGKSQAVSFSKISIDKYFRISIIDLRTDDTFPTFSSKQNFRPTPFEEFLEINVQFYIVSILHEISQDRQQCND